MDRPLYTVVMPCYLKDIKHVKTVFDTVESVRDNSENYEFIIVDDGSTHDTEFLYNYATTFVRHRANRGIAPSWNDGIRLARGTYIAIINDDIVVPKGWLQGMSECFDIDDCGVSAPSVEHLPDNPFKGIQEKQTWFPGSCFMLSQELIKKVGLFDEQFVPFNHEDIDYWYRTTLLGYKLYRNFDYFVKHKEGDVLHSLDYKRVDYENSKRLLKKWGMDPRPLFYD